MTDDDILDDELAARRCTAGLEAAIDLAEWYEEISRDIPPRDLILTVGMAMLKVQEPAHA